VVSAEFVHRKDFRLTGTLPTMKREDAEQKILAAGGKVSGSVGRQTSFVLAGEDAAASSRKPGNWAYVMDEAEFTRLLGPGPGLS
jgi:DNA ligase (NAD+)